jgi:hypothetical protein
LDQYADDAKTRLHEAASSRHMTGDQRKRLLAAIFRCEFR